MTIYEAVINLEPGSDEVAKLRLDAFTGDREALKVYLYFCAFQELKRDKSLAASAKILSFLKLVQADAMEFTLV